MRALTVRQPWAWAIVHGGKDVENRTRNIAGGYRGPVAIHAAKAIADAAAWRDPMVEAAMLEHDVETAWDLTLGHVIGVVDLVDVHWSGMECSRGTAACHEYDLCTPWAQPYYHHLMLANPRHLASPVPAVGRLGLWTLPDDIAAAVAEQLGGAS